MELGLRIILIVIAFFWLILITCLLKKGKLPIKYSMFWYFFSFILLILGILPKILEYFNNFLGFKTISSLVVGLIVSMLMFITLLLTIIVSKQKLQIELLIQEVSILKKKNEK